MECNNFTINQKCNRISHDLMLPGVCVDFFDGLFIGSLTFGSNKSTNISFSSNCLHKGSSMANQDLEKDSLFKEIDEELRHENYTKLWNRYGKYLVGIVVLFVACLLGIRVWRKLPSAVFSWPRYLCLLLL